jgi:3-phenylpropionate/trans-cinnamate dioxygenase ferredoxin subunit
LDEWHRLASVAEVREGEALAADLEGTAIALYRVNGKIHALDDTCTHEFALLSQGFVDGDVVECPLHAAQFEIVTGKCLCGPATEDLKVYEVRVAGDDVLVRRAQSSSG